MSIADYRTKSMSSAPPPMISNVRKEKEPDVHLIKQVEQVARLALEAPPRHFAGILSFGITSAVKAPYFGFGNHLIAVI